MTDKLQSLQRMWLNGEKRIVIASKLGMSVDWVKKRKRKLGLPPRPNFYRGGDCAQP